MPETPATNPEEVPDHSDPGDDTARRYRIQWTWAAIVSCMMLDDTESVDEVFCEHHEDVLLKHSDGKYSGHQVKTREDDQPAWKTSDDAFVTSCVKFIELDATYTGQFKDFHFLTNHPMQASGNGRDISFVLEAIQNATDLSELPNALKSWVKKLSKLASVDNEAALKTLKKTKASSSLPKLHDAVLRLINTVTQCWGPASDCSYDAVKKASLSLVEECGRASSLSHEQLLPGHFLAISDPEEQLSACINGKRMTRNRVLEILEAGRDSTATLSGDLDLCPEPGSGSTELLHAKLSAGGFYAVQKNSAEDLRNKADYLGLEWTKKYGRTKGLGRYDHIRSIVLSDASTAYSTTLGEGDPFGLKMLEALRARIESRRDDTAELYDCTNEHLEGFAYILTSECLVQWSLDTPWEES